ncbi:MAG: class I SAM-dependent methyltransferase family protein [archaeon]
MIRNEGNNYPTQTAELGRKNPDGYGQQDACISVKTEPCLRVHKRTGQKAVRLVDELNIRDRNFKIGREEDHVLIPLNRFPSREEASIIEDSLKTFDLVEASFEERVRPPHDLVEALEGILSPHLLASLPKAVDIIGEIAVIEIPSQLGDYKNVIGEAVMKVNTNVHTVLAKLGPISTPVRVRRFEVISGKGLTETTHHEYGLALRLDVLRTYFSPRLSTEHERVAAQVRENEVVVDMFTGVGPFAIQIAANRRKVIVYAIDINPHAMRYLMQNIMINKVRGRIVAVLGDSSFIIKNHLSAVADRVIMNLPREAGRFVEMACSALKTEGGTLHFYAFSDEPHLSERARNDISKALSRADRHLINVETKVVKSTAPHEWQIVADLHVK